MKKLLLLLFLFAAPVFATTTVTGSLKDLGGTASSSGTFVRFYLRGCAGNQPVVPGAAMLSPTNGAVWYKDFTANGSGAISGTLYSTRDAAGTGNGDILCGNSYTAVWYGMVIFVNGKAGPEFPVHAKNGVTLDITAVTPLSTTPVATAPSGDSTYLRLDGGNSPLTGNISSNGTFSDAGGTHSGTETFSNINGVVVVDGTTYAKTNAGIQSAINATPAGGTVFLPTGTYVLSATTNEQFKITQAINFICAGWGTNLQLAAGVGAIPVMHIVPSGVVSGVRIQDCNFTIQSGTPGSYAIQVDASAGFNEVTQLVIEHNKMVGTWGTGGIWLNNTGADTNGGIFDSHIEHNWITGGILCTLCGDSLNIKQNLIQDSGAQQTIGINASFTAGSSSLRIEDNTINPNGTAIHIGSSATFTQITGNEFETPASTASGSNGAFVDIDGTVGSHTTGVDIYKNSFQIVNSSTLNGLRINYANATNVRDNSFTLGVGAKDIVVTVNATATRVRPNNFNGATIANALSDSAPTGQTRYELGGDSSTQLIFRDVTGTATIYGAGTQFFGQGVAGANYIYDGQANNVTAAATNAPSSAPAAGTYLSVASLSAKEIAAPSSAAGSDVCYADSTAHAVKCSYNNAAFSQMTRFVDIGQVFNAAGTQQTSPHVVEDSGTLSSASPSTATITLSGSAVFTSNSTYNCTVTNKTTQANPLKISYTSGSAFVVTGPNTVTDAFSFICIGN